MIKKHFIGFLLGISLSIIFGFKVSSFMPNASTAEVNKVDGFYIFTDSKPLLPYDSLGVVGTGFITSTQYEALRQGFIKRTREKFPNANGLILHLDRKGIDTCTAIELK